MSTRIVIADDHAMVIEGLKMCFAADPQVQVVGEARNADELLALVRRLRPDVAVVDISMPGQSGIEAIRTIAADKGLATRCLVMSMHGEAEFVTEALRAGARAYILKSNSFKELQQAVRAVMGGSTFLSPQIADLVVSSLAGGVTAAARGMGSLTPRERQTLRLLAEGLSVKAAAERLGVSHKTVHTYRAALMRKLECGSIAELTKLAIRHGVTCVD